MSSSFVPPGPLSRGDPGLTVRVQAVLDPPFVRLVAAGELDVATAPVLAAALDELIGSAPGAVRLELADVPFCDLSGLHVLLDADRKLCRAGGRLTVADPCASLCVLIGTLGIGAALLADPRVLQAYRYHPAA
jgi:anti-sigma B factor antagonist